MLVSSLVAAHVAHADGPRREVLAAPLRLVPPAGREIADPDARRTHPPTPVLLPEPDGTGLYRDTLYFIGMQFAALAVLYASPEGVSGWSEEQIDAAGFDRWRENIGKFEWDRDVWWINYALHPYWGAAYYTRARERGFGYWQAFWYSTLLSTEYELGAEALFENPSIQDLLATPVFGSLLARSVEPWRRRTLARARTASRLERVGLVLSDPLGAVNRQVDRLVARRSSALQAHVAVTGAGSSWRIAANPSGAELPPAGYGDGVTRRWGLEFRVTW